MIVIMRREVRKQVALNNQVNRWCMMASVKLMVRKLCSPTRKCPRTSAQ